MIIVVTGMVGVDKTSYLQQVCSLAEQKGRQITLYNLGQMMYAEAPDIAPGRILDISLGRLHSLRRSVLKDIIAKSRQMQCTIVNTHATFRWRHGLFPAFDFYQMRQLNADMYFCLIDGVEPLHVRLMRDHPIRHSLKDLMVWREEEILATEMMQKGTNENAVFYCLARGTQNTTAETFYRLMFEQWRKKAYLSFPMTHVAELPEVVKQITAFRDAMKKEFICFDPGDLEEAYLPYRAEKAAKAGQKQIALDVLGERISFDVSEIGQIQQDINSQIYARDFALIDQSDMIISFIPALPDGRAAVSSGVERELQHAHEAAKDAYVIWQAKAPPSVFVTQTATKVFTCCNEAMQYLSDKNLA